MSPDNTVRLPVVKLPAEYNVPAVPLLALPLVKKAPAIVPDGNITELMENAVAEVAIVPVPAELGPPPEAEAAPNAAAGRVD